MNDISLFYVDEKEVEMLYVQYNKDVEKKIIIKEENAIDAKLKLGTNVIMTKILSPEITGSGIMNNYHSWFGVDPISS